MTRTVIIAIGAGAASAFVFLGTNVENFGALILGYLAPMPLFLVGLSLGSVAGIIAALAGVGTTLVTAGLAFAAVYTMLSAAPAALVVRQSLLSRADSQGNIEWYPAGLLVTWLCGIGAAVFAAAALAMSGEAGGMEGWIRESLTTVLGQIMPEESARIADIFAPNMPAIMVASWVLMMTFNGALSQGLLVRFGRNARPSPDLAELEVPNWVLYAVVAALVVATLGSGGFAFVGRNLVMIFAMPFFFQGLAVIHAMARRTQAKTLALIITYMLLLFVFWSAIVVVALGLVEQVARLRQRFAGPPQDQEEE